MCLIDAYLKLTPDWGEPVKRSEVSRRAVPEIVS